MSLIDTHTPFVVTRSPFDSAEGLIGLHPADGNPPLSIWRRDEDYVDFDSDDPEDAARWLREPPE